MPKLFGAFLTMAGGGAIANLLGQPRLLGAAVGLGVVLLPAGIDRLLERAGSGARYHAMALDGFGRPTASAVRVVRPSFLVWRELRRLAAAWEVPIESFHADGDVRYKAWRTSAGRLLAEAGFVETPFKWQGWEPQDETIVVLRYSALARHGRVVVVWCEDGAIEDLTASAAAFVRSRDQVGVVRIERELDRRMGGVIGLDEWSPGEHVLDVSTTSEWLIDWGPRGLAAIAGDGLVDHLSRDWPGFTAAVAAARPPEQHHLHLVTGTLTGGFDGEGVPEIRPRAVMLWAGSPTDGYRVQAERIATAWGLPLDRFEPESDAVPYGDWLAKVEDRASALLVGVDVAELALAEMGDPSVDQLILTVPFEVLAERSDMALLRPSREDREGLSAAVAAWATAAGDEGAVRLGWGSDCLIGFWEYFPGDFTLDCGEGMEWLIEWSADDFVVVAGSALIEHLGSTWAGWSRSAAAAT